MKITQREVDNAVILDLNGKLTGGPDADTFREVFKSLIDQGKKNIIVNLEKVSWINSWATPRLPVRRNTKLKILISYLI